MHREGQMNVTAMMPMGRGMLLLLLLLTLSNQGINTNTQAAARPASSSPSTLEIADAGRTLTVPKQKALPEGENLLASSRGVSLVVWPSDYGGSWAAWRMFDENPASGWATKAGEVVNQTFVIESPERILLEQLVFDTEHVDKAGRGAKDLTIEISAVSRDEGFHMVAEITLADRQARQAFDLPNSIPGRWIRITVHTNHGDAEYTELMEIQGFGERLEQIIDQPSVVSFSGGATVVHKPSEYNRSWSALLMLDENPTSGWASAQGQVSDNTMILALPEQTVLEHLIFDTGHVDAAGRGAREVIVEISDMGPDDGFVQIASVTPDDRRDWQVFPVEKEAPGRWVRLTVPTNHGATDYTEIMDFRAVGRLLTATPFASISGSYQTSYGTMHIKQQGTSVTGCYTYNEGLLIGGIEGRVMKLTWREPGDREGPAIMVFSPDGQRLNGLWWYTNREQRAPGFWDGEKISDDIGSCSHWAGGAEEQMTQDLEAFGRARVYGINFDLDSDVIRDESKPTLEKIVSILKAHPAWSVTIEGHTDATGGEAYNQDLSERRAQAVQRYLEQAEIEGTRLQSIGLGATRPVASNEHPLGRAQNRRVELVKQ